MRPGNHRRGGLAALVGCNPGVWRCRGYGLGRMVVCTGPHSRTLVMAAVDPPVPVPPSISVIVPVLHDAAQLAALLPRLPGRPRCEVVVANGDAGDAAVGAIRAARPDVVWVESEPGRGRQMNAGAARAAGAWLLFLHADARPDAGWVDEIERAGAAGAVGGCFRLRIDSRRWPARVIEAGVRWRVRWLGIAYGDQAVFVRRDLFRRLGGYRPMPVMEDADLVRRIRSRGRFWRVAGRGHGVGAALGAGRLVAAHRRQPPHPRAASRRPFPRSSGRDVPRVARFGRRRALTTCRAGANMVRYAWRAPAVHGNRGSRAADGRPRAAGQEGWGGASSPDGSTTC